MFKKQKIIFFALVFLVLLLIFSVAGLSGCSTSSTGGDSDEENISEAESTTRVITDSVGRTHTVPKDIKKIYTTSPVAAILTYTLAPEKIAGWNYELRPAEVKYILPELRNLPNFGGWQSKSTGNIEEILKAKPDVIISMGDNLGETDISFADKLQDQLGIPVIIVELPLLGMGAAYDFMGDLLRVQERAAELAAYYRETLEDIQAKAAQIPDSDRIRVYYAEGPEGLQTEPYGSMHIQTLELVGGLNVAGDVEAGGKGGQSPVSFEQVLAWDPDVIICWNKSSGGAYEVITTDSRWAELKAVQNKQVYEIPSAPYNWFDRPPSVNRIIGFKWLGNLLYPDIYTYDIISEARDFYKQFYHYDLTVEEAEELLVNSLRK